MSRINFRGPRIALQEALERLRVLCNDVRAHADILIRIVLLARCPAKLFPRLVHHLEQTARRGFPCLGRGFHGAFGTGNPQSHFRINTLGLGRSTNFVREFLGHGSRSLRKDEPF